MRWKRFLISLAALALCGQPQFAAEQQEREAATETKQVEKERTEKVVNETTADAEAKKQPRKLKVFELKHVQPSQLAQLMHYRRQTVHRPVGGFGGPSVDVVQEALPSENLNMAFDDERKLLFIRGPAEKINQLEKVVKALDVSPDKLEKQTFGKMHLIPLRQSEAGQIQSVLSQLGMAAHSVQLGEASMIVVSEADEEEIEQIQEVISKLEDAGKRRAATATTTAPEQERR